MTEKLPYVQSPVWPALAANYLNKEPERGNLHWREKAYCSTDACGWSRADVDAAVFPRTIHEASRRPWEALCSYCPVMAECGREGDRIDAEGAVYGGRYYPAKDQVRTWQKILESGYEGPRKSFKRNPDRAVSPSQLALADINAKYPKIWLLDGTCIRGHDMTKRDNVASRQGAGGWNYCKICRALSEEKAARKKANGDRPTCRSRGHDLTLAKAIIVTVEYPGTLKEKTKRRCAVCFKLNRDRDRERKLQRARAGRALQPESTE